MIQIAKPSIERFEKETVMEVLDSGNLVCGDKVEELEKRFADYIGVKHAVAVNCLDEDTLITMSDNSQKKIKDLMKGDKVLSFDGGLKRKNNINNKDIILNETIEEDTIKNVWNSGTKEIYKLSLRNREILATENHRFLKVNRLKRNHYEFLWVKLKELKKEDIVLIIKKLKEINPERDIPLEHMDIISKMWYLVGLFVGDGWLRHRRIRNYVTFATGNMGEVETYKRLVKELFDYDVKISVNKKGVGQVFCYNKHIVKFFKDLDLQKYAIDKRIPKSLWKQPDKIKESFLKGYIKSDGHINKKGRICFVTPNKLLLNEIKMLSIQLGYRTDNIFSRNDGGKKKICNHWCIAKNSYSLGIYNSNKKGKILHGRYNEVSLKCFEESEFIGLNKVRKVEFIGKKTTYDIETKKNHNFIADGIIVHNSGTSALHCAYLAINKKPYTGAITTPLTFNATINMLKVSELSPHYIDIKDDFNINVDKIRKWMTVYDELIVPVHLYGLPCKVDEISEIAERNGSVVIEDCAQACGAEFKGHKVGSWGDLGAFSFYGSKMITTAEGGMVTTNDPEIAEKIRDLRWHSLNQGGIGYNYRMTDIGAAIGIEQLKRIDRFIEKRRKIAKIYNEEFEGLIDKLPTEKEHIYNSYSFCIKNRTKFILDMNRLAIDCRVYYPKPFCDLPNATRICNEVVSIPIRPNLKDQEISYIVDSVKKCLK